MKTTYELIEADLKYEEIESFIADDLKKTDESYYAAMTGMSIIHIKYLLHEINRLKSEINLMKSNGI